MKSRLVLCISALVLSIAITPCARAQENPNLEIGLKPYGAYQGGNLDRISMTNGNLSFFAPLVSYPQRGGKLRQNYMLRYNNKNFYIKETCDALGDCTTRVMLRPETRKGLSVEVVDDQAIQVQSQMYWVDPYHLIYIYTVTTPDGSLHQLADTGAGLRSIDASGILDNRDRTGSTVNVIGATFLKEDPNGNQISNDGYSTTDTTGRVTPNQVATTDYSGCTGPRTITSAKTWSFPGPMGTSVVKLCYVTIPIQTNFGATDFEYSFSKKMLQSILLPNLTSWTFEYDSRDPGDSPSINYGDLTKITFPTGGTISYTWMSSGVERIVITRAMNANDGGGPHTWTYTWGVIPGGNMVTDPLGNDSVHIISGLGNGQSFYEIELRQYQGSRTTGTLLKTVQTQYAYTDNPYGKYTGDAAAKANVVPTRITTIWPNGKQTKVEKDYDSGFSFLDPDPYHTIWLTGTFGNVTAQREYDYGAGAPGPLLRQTATTYLALSNSTYKNLNLIDLVSSVIVRDGASTLQSQTLFAYDGSALQASGITTQRNQNPPSGLNRGNLTSTQRWLNTSGSYLTSYATYFDTGMTYQSTDPGGHATTFSYSSTFAGAYVTQTQFPNTNSPSAAQHIISGNYNFNSGLLTSFTDENGNVSSYTYDNMWRITSAVFPPQNGLNGETDFYYPDVLTVERKQKIDATRWTDLFVRFDGLGREIRRITANDETTPWDQADSCYNNRGEKSFGSYPYQGSGLSAPQVCSGAGDSFTYDALGRVTRVTHSDGTYVQTDYTGPATRITDEGNGTHGLQRVSQMDGLGRLTSICEVTSTTLIGITPTPAACSQDIAATGFLTSYSYAYNAGTSNLTFTVQQGGLNPRTAIYDSLSRLTSSANPEAGTISYSYNSDGLLSSRVAPAPNQANPAVTVTTNYSYDELHRPRSRTYVNDTNSTPAATLNYDQASAFGVTLLNALGKQTSLSVANGQGQTLSAEVFSYDSMGRVLNNSQCTPQNCVSGTFPISYTYDLIGDLLSATNGFGVTLGYAYNRAARLSTLTSSLSDTNHPGTLASAVHYNAFGGQTTASLGSGESESLGYTARGLLQSVSATLGGNGVYSFSLTFAGNGDVLTGNDSVNGNWTYGYDDFNRLASAVKTGVSYTYDYDRFGNRWHQNGPSSSSLGFDANNRITGSGVIYDAAGNVTNDGQNSYSYDAENRIISTSGPNGTGAYVYNAAGVRIRKTTASGTVDYLYDLAGHALTEVNSSGAWTRSEVFAGSHHVATYKDGPTGTTYFSHTDWLGTERVRTNKVGTVVESCTNLPFGDAQNCAGTDLSPLHFNGKQRDTETDDDYFGGRYYISRHGRWLTPDWSSRQEAVPYASLTNPQTLNLYAYVGNNPVSQADADGHEASTYSGLPEGREFVLAYAPSTENLAELHPGFPTQDVATEQQQQNQQQQQAQMSLSAQGLDFIKNHESFRAQVYLDVAGNPTIGYGHLIRPGENFANGITQQQATALLAQDVKAAVGAVNKNLMVQVSQTKFDALVSFTFNLGAKNLQKSTLLANINSGQSVTKKNFTDYNHAGGQVVRGLTIRRTNEYNLFSSGAYGMP